MDPAIVIPRKDVLSDTDRIAMPIMTKAFIFYKLSSSTNLENVTTSFREGLKNATHHFPFVAGDIEYEVNGMPYISTNPGERTDMFVIRHFTSTEHKSFSAMSSSSFSPADLVPDKLLPTLPTDKRPVCSLQLTFIEGGLILGFMMNHVAGDWGSMDAFLCLLCRGSKAHQEGLEMPTYTPDLDRTPYNAQFEVDKHNLPEGLDLYHVIEKGTFIPKSPPPFQTSIYRITDASLQELKQKCGPLDEVEYVSSYDCLSALLWISTTRARLQLEPEKSTTLTSCINPVNLRSRDPEKKTSEEYFGNSAFPARAGPTESASLMSENGLAVAASSIRKSIQKVTIDSVAGLASLVSSLAPNEALGYHADFHDMDILINSWYSATAEKYDIGTESLPTAFRTHRPITGGVALVLPNFSKGPAREYEVFVQLESQQHELLRQDAEFARYFEHLA